MIRRPPTATLFPDAPRFRSAFREDYPEAAVALLYLGNERLSIDGIPCIPCEEFLAGLHPETMILAS